MEVPSISGAMSKLSELRAEKCFDVASGVRFDPSRLRVTQIIEKDQKQMLIGKVSAYPVGSAAYNAAFDQDAVVRCFSDVKELVAYESNSLFQPSHLVLPVLGAVRLGDEFGLIFPYMRDGNLLDLLVRFPDLSATHRLLLARDMAEALLHIHSRGFVHGNLTPQNVLISPCGSALLADATNRFQRRRAAPGAYAAAEVAQLGLAPSRAADMFSLGLVLLLVLSGEEPSAQLLRETARPGARLAELVPLADGAPLKALVVALLAGEPSRRPDARDALEQVRGALQAQRRLGDFRAMQEKMSGVVRNYTKIVHAIRGARRGADKQKRQLQKLTAELREYKAAVEPALLTVASNAERLEHVRSLVEEDRQGLAALRQGYAAQNERIAALADAREVLERRVGGLRAAIDEAKLENSKLFRLVAGVVDKMETGDWSDPEPTAAAPSDGTWDSSQALPFHRHEAPGEFAAPRRGSEGAAPPAVTSGPAPPRPSQLKPSPLSVFDRSSSPDSPLALSEGDSAHSPTAPAAPATAHAATAAAAPPRAPSRPGTNEPALTTPSASRPSTSAEALPPLPQPFRNVNVFEAFRGAGELPFVAALFTPAANKKRGKSVAGVTFTNVTETPIPGGNYNGIATCVTGSGVFVWYDHSLRALHLFEFSSARHVLVKGIRDYCFVASIGDLVAVGVRKATVLLRATTAQLLEKPILSTFVKGTVPEINGAIAFTDLAPWTAKVVYRGPYFYPVELDIRTLQHTIHRQAGQLSCLLSLTGIAVPGVRCVAFRKARDSLSVFAFDDDWREHALGTVQKTAYTLLPSTADPADLDKAAWLDHSATLYHAGKTATLSAPVRPRVYQPFARLYRDAFLVFDEKRRQWVICRVRVP